ncbi:MAG: hypothetical protein LBU68_02850 [Rickettsiales bacterium]|nr:hypothetical protein [Rickettsiales bacterium]
MRKKKHTADVTKNTESLSKTSIKRSNLYIFIAAIVCIGLFATAVVLNKGNKIALPTADNQTNATEQNINNLGATISPDVDLSPTSVSMNNIEVDASSEAVINLIVKDAATVISKIELNAIVPSVQLTDTCTSREKMDIGERCIITVSYNPVEAENRSLSLLITLNPVGKPDIASQINKTIPVSVSSKAAVVFEPPPEPEPEPEPIEETEEEYIEEEIVEEEPVNIPPPDTSNDCRRYAARGRTRSGDFLGWIQSNKTVLSPNCQETIGTLQDDGKIVRVGTGEIIGIGPRLDGNKTGAFDDRALQEIPDGLRDPIFDMIDTEERAIANSNAMANRQAAKAGDFRTPKMDLIESAREGSDGVDPYRASDPLNVMQLGRNEFIPPSIMDPAQISSFPKKNQYTLRENKAIPAVLNRAVKFFDQKGGDDGEAYGFGFANETSDNCGGGIRVTATVERNVYADTGRTIILPAGTLVYGCAETPAGEDKTKVFERVHMSWDRFVRPDGAEFNIAGAASGGSEIQTFSGDAQGQDGVPGKRDTGYMKRMLLEPIMYSLLPIAVNMISPSTQLLKQTYNEGVGGLGGLESANYMTIETEGEVSSTEKAKAEIIENWRTVTQEMMGNTLKNFQPPFTIPAGTRLTIFVQSDLILRLTETKGEMTGIVDEEAQ